MAALNSERHLGDAKFLSVWRKKKQTSVICPEQTSVLCSSVYQELTTTFLQGKSCLDDWETPGYKNRQANKITEGLQKVGKGKLALFPLFPNCF